MHALSRQEWEHAARGGLEDEPFPWGSAADTSECNGWTGNFATLTNDEADGWMGTAPVDWFKPNG